MTQVHYQTGTRIVDAAGKPVGCGVFVGGTAGIACIKEALEAQLQQKLFFETIYFKKK